MTSHISTKLVILEQDAQNLATRIGSIAAEVVDLRNEYQSLERSYLATCEALELARRQVLIHELADRGQGLDENDIPYDLAKKEVLTNYGAPALIVSKEFLHRMYEALPEKDRLPQHLYGGTLGDEYRALTGRKGY